MAITRIIKFAALSSFFLWPYFHSLAIFAAGVLSSIGLVLEWLRGMIEISEIVVTAHECRHDIHDDETAPVSIQVISIVVAAVITFLIVITVVC